MVQNYATGVQKQGFLPCRDCGAAAVAAACGIFRDFLVVPSCLEPVSVLCDGAQIFVPRVPGGGACVLSPVLCPPKILRVRVVSTECGRSSGVLPPQYLPDAQGRNYLHQKYGGTAGYHHPLICPPAICLDHETALLLDVQPSTERWFGI